MCELNNTVSRYGFWIKNNNGDDDFGSNIVIKHIKL